jgi:hypothetical protein
MPAVPSFRKYRVAGLLSCVSAAAAIVAALVLEVATIRSELARTLLWTGIALLILFVVVVHYSLYRIAKLRGLSDQERRETRMRATWGGPLGALFALWALTERRGPDAAEPPRSS